MLFFFNSGVMKKVLIAIDYNPVSEKVAEAGYELAKMMGAQVCLMHVMADIGYYSTPFPTFMGYEGLTTAPDMNVALELRNIGEDYLQSAARHLNDETVTTYMGEGDTARSILKYAKEWQANLIVMGTQSHSALEKILLGTVASKVLEKTEIPVYMVPVKK